MKKLHFPEFNRLSLRSKLLFPVMGVTLLLLLLNLFMFLGTNHSIRNLDSVYESSIQINALEEATLETEKYFTDYMNTRSDDAFQHFRISMANMKEMTDQIQAEITGNPASLLDREIFYLSASYYAMAERSITMKQQYDGDYRQYYREATNIHTYILKTLRRLNTLRFQKNSIRYESALDSLQKLETYILVVLILTAGMEGLLLYDFLSALVKPLQVLSMKAREIESGNMDVDIPETTAGDEVGVLTRAFASMMKSVRAGIEEIRSSAKRELALKEKELMTENLLKDAKLRYYQAQISPHFLFNTLNAGQQLAMMEGAERTYIFINNTAEFFRGQLHGAGQDSTIGQEIELIDHYMYIMNVRFSGEYHLEKRIQDKMLSVRFPGMILQPIVENAIHYAFPEDEDEASSVEQEKKITITAVPEGNECIVSVRDNGVGISPEIIHEVMTGPIETGKKTTRRENNGVGLKNVRERLRMFYERPDVFDIHKAEDGGTEVTIRIPLREE